MLTPEREKEIRQISKDIEECGCGNSKAHYHDPESIVLELLAQIDVLRAENKKLKEFHSGNEFACAPDEA